MRSINCLVSNVYFFLNIFDLQKIKVFSMHFNFIFICVCPFSDQVVTQILDELGLQLNDQLSGLPQVTGSLSVSSKTAAPAAAVGGASGSGGGGGGAGLDADADLQARLDNLRKH